MVRVENKDICSECGGYCCKKCGCDYFVSDFERLKIDVIEEELATGKASIVAALNFRAIGKDKMVCDPILYLRARNINRDEIDLLSFKTTCASLTSNGCSYSLDKRPSGGASLIPRKIGNDIACFTEVDRIEELNKWIPYQSILSKVVKRHTGMNVMDKVRYDVENLFYNIIKGNFDCVAESELKDVASMIPMLYKTFPEEYNRAKRRTTTIPPFMLVK